MLVNKNVYRKSLANCASHSIYKDNDKFLNFIQKDQFIFLLYSKFSSSLATTTIHQPATLRSTHHSIMSPTNENNTARENITR